MCHYIMRSGGKADAPGQSYMQAQEAKVGGSSLKTVLNYTSRAGETGPWLST